MYNIIYLKHDARIVILSLSLLMCLNVLSTLNSFSADNNQPNLMDKISLLSRKGGLSFPEARSDWKKIILWTPYFGSHMKSWKNVFQRHIRNECKENRCKISRSRKNMLEADAIVFNGNDLWLKKPSLYRIPFIFPRQRSQKQIYVFNSFEPPTHLLFVNLSLYTNFFNWTMSYRKDSDVYVPYGLVTKNQHSTNKFFPLNDSELKQKKFSVWMNSHCGTRSEREKLVAKLQQYVSVDVYGLCGTLKCHKSVSINNVEPDSDIPCKSVIQNYIFYLALENSLCKDYVSEKLYHALKLGVIPVVLGDPDYSLHAPPHSFIDVRDFKSVQELANYMYKVSQDVNLYNEYFKWRDTYDIELGFPHKALICGLCEKLHSPNATRISKTYESIDQWFVEDASCHAWKEEQMGAHTSNSI